MDVAHEEIDNASLQILTKPIYFFRVNLPSEKLELLFLY